MNKTGIEYLDYTWNPTVGCSPISSGCKNCWARIMSKRLKAMGQKDYQLDDPFKPRFLPHRLDEPIEIRKPSRIGVSFMGDLFHSSILDGEIIHILITCVMASQHTYLILTKRPRRILELVKNTTIDVRGFPENVWLGVSVEDQKTYDERVSVLIQIPAAKRWVSYEPALEKIYMMTTEIDWMVMGAETGPGARPFEIEWARDTRDQCEFGGIPFFFKSAGKQVVPPDLQIREYPKCGNGLKKYL